MSFSYVPNEISATTITKVVLIYGPDSSWEMFSLSGMSPLFPSLLPRQADPLWHRVDLPRDEDAELTKMEKENEDRMKGFTQVLRNTSGGRGPPNF